MKKRQFLGSILSFALVSFGIAQAMAASAQDGEHYTQSQRKKMAEEAHSPEQYRALAIHYGKLQKDYLQQAAEEKQEWARRSQITTSLYAKYPKPADSARNLYEYYVEKASDAGALSAKYSQLAEATSTAALQHM
jgi:hypothetical protein